MTPLPRSATKPRLAGLRRMRQDNPIPMTASQYLRWLNKKRPAVSYAVTYGDILTAAAGGPVDDEVDNGYLGAIRLQPRKVGIRDGEVPLAIASRLVNAGLARKAANDN